MARRRLSVCLFAWLLATSVTPVWPALPAMDELTEFSSADWFAWAQYASASVHDDTARVKVGDASLRFETDGGFDTAMGTPVSQAADWDLSQTKALRFWVYAVNPNIGFQSLSPWVQFHNSDGAYREVHATSDVLNEARNQWMQFVIPLSGGPGWTVSEQGTPDMTSVDWLEIHTDTWDAGFTLWYDGFEFVPYAGSGAPATDLTATAYHSTVELTWTPSTEAGVTHYEVYRRPQGSQQLALVGYSFDEASFSDHGLTPDATYEYVVVGMAPDETPLTALSDPATASLDVSSIGYTSYASLDVLVAIYTAGFTTAQVDAMVRGIELAIEFYWRTSEGNLLMRPRWLIIDETLPGSDWGHPDLIADLRARGVHNDQYDLGYLVGDGVPGCLGGYLAFGSMCSSLGYVCGVPYPLDDPLVNTTIVWTFTHEIHHALELMENITGSVTPEVLFCHFPWCYPDPLGPTGWHMDWGPHFDGIGLTNREYGDAWSLYPPPYDDYVEALDPDQDRMPSEDDRFPTDEARLGSNAAIADSDVDGLDDMAEYACYNFRGTEPTHPDSDGDGILDGADDQPLYRVPSALTKISAPTIDGALDPEWPLLSDSFYYSRSGGSMRLDVYAGWDDSNLYVAAVSDRKLRFALSIDGSGEDGRFASPVRHVDGQTDTSNSNNKHNHIGDSWADGNHIEFAHGDAGAQVWGRSAVTGAEVASSISGLDYITELRLPRTLPGGAAYTWYPEGSGTPVVDGLTLETGHIIGLNLVVSEYYTSGGGEYAGTWTCLFEPHSFVDFELTGYADTTPPQIVSWSVCGNHENGVGEIDCSVSDGSVESRGCGISRLRVAFTEPLNPGSVTASAISITGVNSGDCSSEVDVCGLEGDGSVLCVDLSAALADQDTYVIEVSDGIEDSGGNALSGDRDIIVSALKGDANGDERVDIGDLLRIRSQNGEPVGTDNARCDVNLDGQINVGDLLAARSCNGNSCPGLTAAGDLTVQEPVITELLTFTYEPGWHRFSTPMLEPLRIEELTSEPEADYAVYVQERPQVERVPPEEPMKPARGYWLQTPMPLRMQAPEPRSVEIAAPRTFVCDLPTGWSMLGCPFLIPIGWDDSHVSVAAGGVTMPLSEAVAAGWLYPAAWGWADGGNLRVDVGEGMLEPWRAYFVNARTPCSLTLRPGTMTTGGGSGGEADAEDAWSIELVARAGQFHDRGVTIGTSSASRIEPHPPLGPGVDLFIRSGEMNPGAAVDLRTGPIVREHWDVLVTTGLAETEIELTWPDLSSLPADLSAYLVDEAAGKRVYMRTTQSYTVRSGADGCMRPLRVEIKERSDVATMAAVTAQAARSGGVEVALTLSADASVDVRIMNIAGRHVARLASDELLPAGTTRLYWDGRASSGTRVPSGKYLVQVTATGEDGQCTSAICLTSTGQ